MIVVVVCRNKCEGVGGGNVMDSPPGAPLCAPLRLPVTCARSAVGSGTWPPPGQYSLVSAAGVFGAAELGDEHDTCSSLRTTAELPPGSDCLIDASPRLRVRKL